MYKNNSLDYTKNRVEIFSSLYSYLRRELFMGIQAEGKLRKIGNSLGVIIPANILKKIGVGYGDTVTITYENGEVKIKNPDNNVIDEDLKEKVIAILDEYFKEHGSK
jgi:putative addiction module antidote